jgi:hypothetical protein
VHWKRVATTQWCDSPQPEVGLVNDADAGPSVVAKADAKEFAHESVA